MAAPVGARRACAPTTARSAARRSRTRILKALKQNLLTPELVAEFTRAYQEEVNRLTKEASGRAAEVEAKLAGVQRKIDGIMRAIEDGLYQPSMKARLTELEGEKAALVATVQTRDVPEHFGASEPCGCVPPQGRGAGDAAGGCRAQG